MIADKFQHYRSIMLKKDRENSVTLNQYLAKWVLASVMFTASNMASALSGGDVLNKMNSEQQYAYIGGVIGGLAYARFLRDKPDETGMTCIYDWYYDADKSVWPQIETWLSRHAEKAVEPLIYVLVKKECGE